MLGLISLASIVEILLTESTQLVIRSWWGLKPVLLSAVLLSPAPVIHLCLSWHKDSPSSFKVGSTETQTPLTLAGPAPLRSRQGWLALLAPRSDLPEQNFSLLLPQVPLRVWLQAYHSPFLLQGPLTEKPVPQPYSQLLWTHSPCCSYCLMTSWALPLAGSFLIPGISHFLQWNARTYFLAVSC